MQRIGCPESFTEPQDLYRICTSKGMTHVTITDHNEIAGCLEIAHLPNTFISDEVTTYFPEDGCKLHVCVYDITEGQFRIIEELRENVYEFVEYLQREKISHSLAHPFFAVSDKLNVEHLEKCLLLFKCLEINGDQNPEANAFLRIILNHLTSDDIEGWADKHGIHPSFPEPWRKAITAGSDDHSSLHLARAYTQVDGAESIEDFFEAVNLGKNQLSVLPANPQMMAHNIFATVYQFYKSKFGLAKHVNKDFFMKFLDRFLNAAQGPDETILSKISLAMGQRKVSQTSPSPKSFIELLRRDAQEIVLRNPELLAVVRGNASEASMELKWFDFVHQVSNSVLAQVGEYLISSVSGGNILDAFATVGSAGALVSALAPCFVGYSLHTKERQFARRALQHFVPFAAKDCFNEHALRIAEFTDTYHEINGVSHTLRQQARAAQKLRLDYQIFTCSPTSPEAEACLRNFVPIGECEIPEYPQQKCYPPPFLEMLDRCYNEQYTHIHATAPGPMGLAALGIARILRIPITATYHTAFPQFAFHLTDSSFIEDVMWKYMLWFYDQMDVVLCPSKATADELEERGLNPRKLRIYPRGVDTERFHPSNRSDSFRHQLAIPDAPVLLYVGRVSKEKNLNVLAEAFKALIQAGHAVNLLVVGDGPYAAELKTELAGLPCHFTGFLEGGDLAAAYASSDIFIFTSTTDTFGNVILEAQASGLPVIATDCGGPRENISHGTTGLIVPSADIQALVKAVDSLLSNPTRRTEMGCAGRVAMEERSFEQAFHRTWQLYAGRTEPRSSKTETNAYAEAV